MEKIDNTNMIHTNLEETMRCLYAPLTVGHATQVGELRDRQEALGVLENMKRNNIPLTPEIVEICRTLGIEV